MGPPVVRQQIHCRNTHGSNHAQPTPHGYGVNVRKLVVTLTSVLFICGTIGSNIGPALVDEHPVYVLFLSARNRNLFGSVPFIDPLPYFAIGFVRLMLAAMALFLWVVGMATEPSTGCQVRSQRCQRSTAGQRGQPRVLAGWQFC